MKTRNFIKPLMVATGVIYIGFRSRGALASMAFDGTTLVGYLLLLGLLTLGIVRVLRS